MGIAEFHEARAFRVFDDAALERDGAHFIRLSAAWPHGLSRGGHEGVADGNAASLAFRCERRDRTSPQPAIGTTIGGWQPCAGDTEWTNIAISRDMHLVMRSVSQDVPIGSSEISLAQLNERSREIFRQIVESYLATGEPVGSRNLCANHRR